MPPAQNPYVVAKRGEDSGSRDDLQAEQGGGERDPDDRAGCHDIGERVRSIGNGIVTVWRINSFPSACFADLASIEPLLRPL